MDKLLTTSIHPTAVIDPSAEIEEGAEIGPYALLGPQVIIRSGAVIGAHAVLEYATIGPECRIFPHAFIGLPPQDISYRGAQSRVEIGPRTIIRECATVHRSKREGGVTRIGEGCMLMNYAHVAHDCILGNFVMMANYTGFAGHVEVGDLAFLSGHIGVHQYVRVGKLTMISAGSMVGKDVPPFCVAQGDRAALAGLNLVGLRRAGFNPETIRKLKNAYKTLFLSKLPLEEAIAQLSGEADPRVQELAAFIEGSKRGILRPRASALTTLGGEVTGQEEGTP